MDLNATEVIVINMIKEAVESKGCQLTDVDFNRLTVKVDGPDDDVGACSRAVAEILD